MQEQFSLIDMIQDLLQVDDESWGLYAFSRDILKARKEKKFESFKDIKERVPMLADPVKLISKRILMELEGNIDKKGKRKYILFTRPPKKEKPDHPRF